MGTGWNEVIFDGWTNVALGSGGMMVKAALHGEQDRKALLHMYMNEFHALIFA